MKIFFKQCFIINSFLYCKSSVHYPARQSLLVTASWTATSSSQANVSVRDSARGKVIAANKHRDPWSHKGSCSPAAMCVYREQRWGQAAPRASPLRQSVAQNRLMYWVQSPFPREALTAHLATYELQFWHFMKRCADTQCLLLLLLFIQMKIVGWPVGKGGGGMEGHSDCGRTRSLLLI